MFSNVLSRVIVGVFSMTILLGFRLYMAHYMIDKLRRDSQYLPEQRQGIVYTRPPNVPPDHSGWVVFSTGDQGLGTITRHARLFATSSTGPGAPAAPAGSSLELVAGKTTGTHAIVTLPGVTSCASLTTLKATFNGHQSARLTVKPGTEATCSLDILDYENFVESIRDAEVLTIEADHVPAITFAVSGLYWD